MKRILIALFVAATLFGCKQKEKSASANPELAKLFDQYFEDRMKLYPLEATAQGDNRYNDQLPIDISQPFRDSVKVFYQKYLDKISAYNRESLDENDQISYDIFKREMQMNLEGLTFKATWEIPFQQFWGLPLTMGQLGSGAGNQPFKTVKDYQNWLKRISAFSIWADTAISNFKAGMADGTVLPKALVVKMIPQMESMVVTDASKSLFYDPIKNMPKDFSDADKKTLTDAYTKAILTELVPTYQKLGTFLKTEYLPKARTSTGISAIPNGDAYYKYLVRFWTTTDKTPQEIYETGLAEVKRIRTEMEKTKNQVGFKGDLPAFFEFMKTDKQFMPFKTPKEVLDSFEHIHQIMIPQLNKLFGRTPKTKFEIRQTEAFRAASASAEYNQGSEDGSRPGVFYVPILDAKTFNITSGMESLFLHEAIPGHHYQISLQQENTELPKFRRFAWYGAYGEGWALYTESLGKELGLYTNPYQYMGALGDEIHRAIRLVVDVGMHTKNMTREEAIKYLMDNEAISEQGATAEIERYMAIPAQALSYKIGALKIRELRNKYEKSLGAKFKISDFHDEVLKDGVMPLDVFERKMDAWAAKQK
ncbi:DUF885 domain-containing protein [Pelobium sp.]|nr:DUF885 domain-containing protein [Pelobium sp.]MDA9554825.1 DUF885 domain-containing protein [Pelobium sp.]